MLVYSLFLILFWDIRKPTFKRANPKKLLFCAFIKRGRKKYIVNLLKYLNSDYLNSTFVITMIIKICNDEVI